MVGNTTEHKKLSIILPTYNEKENVAEMYSRLKNIIDQLNINYEIIFVDDNSPDGTIEIIKRLRKKDENVKYILMLRRFGDQISLMAGLDYASGDIVITMDSDLQHPPKYIHQMIKKWKEGFDVVIMKREEEGHKNFFKKWTEIIFYKLLDKLSQTPIYYRFSGFALMDKKAVNALRQFRERAPFVRGLIALVGFNPTEIYYKEEERTFGRSKYSFCNMLKLAIKGITSFSNTPLYFSIYLGLIAVFISLIYAIYVIIEKLFFHGGAPDWVSLIIIVIFLGGVNLISIGVLGVYIGKIFIESRKRPNYLIAESEGIYREDE